MSDLHQPQNNTKENSTGYHHWTQTTLTPRVSLSASRSARSRPSLAKPYQSRIRRVLLRAITPLLNQRSIHQEASGVYSLKVLAKYLLECAYIDIKRYGQALKLAFSWLIISLNPSEPALARHSQIASHYYWLNTGAYTGVMKKTDATTDKFVANDHRNSLR